MIWDWIGLQMEFPTLFSIICKITLILCFGWGIHFCLLRHNPRWRVLLWRSIICVIFLIPFVSVAVPAYRVNLSQVAAFNDRISTSAPADMPSSILGNLPWLAIIWIAVALVFAARLLVTSLWLKRIVASSVPAPLRAQKALKRVARKLGQYRDIDLRYSPRVETPFICGLRKPVILLPERMIKNGFANEKQGIFAHEVTHLQENDLWWMLIIQWVQVLLWFNPLIWPVREIHSGACEDVCDAVAADYLGNIQAYSQTLARVALDSISTPKVYGGIAMIRKSEIHRRLELLKRRIGASPLTKSRIGMFFLVAGILLAVISGFQLVTERNLLSEVLAQESREEADDYLTVAEVMPKFKTGPPMPKMPSDIARAGVDTTMTVRIFVDEKGAVVPELTGVKVSSGYPELDKITLEWVKKIEFHPALNLGRPVKVQFEVPIQWKSK